MDILNRLIMIIFGIVAGFGPIVIIFIIYKLARGKRGKEIFYTGKEFTAKSFFNYFLLFAIGLLVISLLLFGLKYSKSRDSRSSDFFGKKYVSKDVENCKLIDFDCQPNEIIFQDGLGCGCMNPY